MPPIPGQPQVEKPLSSKLSDMLLRIIDDDSRNAHLVYQIYCHRRAHAIADWCLRARLTGRELQGFLNQACGGSSVFFLAEVCRRLDREGIRRPIVVGKDWAPK